MRPSPSLTIAMSLGLVVALSRPGVGARVAAAEPRGPRVLLETNPLAPVFRGASLGGRVILAAAPRWSFGGGAYAFTLPGLFVDQLPGNADEGWEVAIRPAAYLSVDRHLKTGGAGFGFGASLVVARFAIGNTATDDTTAITQLYLVPRVTYTWFAWRDLFVQPSLGVELHVRAGGDPMLADRTFEPPTVQPSPGVMVGYRF